MKTFRLILHNIKRIAIHNRATFFIVIFSLIITTFGVLFYSGYIYNVSMERRIDYGEKLELYVSADSSTQDLKDIISKIEHEQDIQSILVSYEKPTQQDGTYDIVGEYNKLYSERILSGKYFERDEKNGVVVLPEYSVGEIAGYNEFPIGKTLELDNTNLTIMGVISFLSTDYLVVPVDYYIENYSTEYICCTYNNSIQNNLYEELSADTNIESICVISQKPILFTTSFWIEFGQILLIFTASIINLFAIIWFWIVSNKRTYNIYSICGSSKAKIICLITGQSFMVIFTGTILGAGLFSVFANVLGKYNLIATENLLLYLLVTILMLCITFLFSIIVTIKSNISNEIYHIKE